MAKVGYLIVFALDKSTIDDSHSVMRPLMVMRLTKSKKADYSGFAGY
jgi:hypothetical protein